MMWFTIDDTTVGVVSICIINRIYVNYIAIWLCNIRIFFISLQIGFFASIMVQRVVYVQLKWNKEYLYIIINELQRVQTA